jgi:membrane-bound serine protease (ClpP class)
MDPMLVWGASLIGVAALLLLIEVFVPSGGIIAVVSVLAGVSGVVCLFFMDENPILWGVLGMLSLVVLFPLAFLFWLKVMPLTPMGRVLLGEPTKSVQAAKPEPVDPLAALVGREAMASTPLRPVGKVEIGGERYEAIVEGAPVEVGERVRVVATRGHELRVRRV